MVCVPYSKDLSWLDNPFVCLEHFRKTSGKNGANGGGVPATGGGGSGGMPENTHIFQEYTYKKITPCDICSQILRGKSSIL